MAIRFTSLLRDLIIESSRFQVVYDKYVKPDKRTRSSAMTFQTLFNIISADPTSRIPEGMTSETAKPEDMEKVKIGKYTQWLLKNYATPSMEIIGIDNPNDPAVKQALKRYQEMFLEDLFKVTGDLMKFEKFKGRLPQEYRDINKLTPSTLYDQVKDFSLEKTKATKEEKQEASTTYKHPGADIVYRGTDWTVAKISDKGQLGKDAACFYGGYYLEPQKGETRWCTSSPGLNWFNNYINKGPLYVIIPNSPRKFTGSMDVGEKSGLPALRYQFHFQDNQYMDPADRQIDWVKFLNEQEPGLKEYFKPEIIKNLSIDPKDKKVHVSYSTNNSSVASRFIALYGFEEFFNSLPDDITRIAFENQSGNPLEFDLPKSIGRFKNLSSLHFQNCLRSIPQEVCNCKNLQFLSFPDNPNMQKLPECFGDLPRLTVLNFGKEMSSDKVAQIVPQKIIDKSNEGELMLFPPPAE